MLSRIRKKSCIPPTVDRLSPYRIYCNTLLPRITSSLLFVRAFFRGHGDFFAGRANLSISLSSESQYLSSTFSIDCLAQKTFWKTFFYARNLPLLSFNETLLLSTYPSILAKCLPFSLSAGRVVTEMPL